MLLVGHDQPQTVVLHTLAEQCMRADHHLPLPVGNGCQRLAALCGTHAAQQQAAADAQGRKRLLRALPMLTGKDFRGCHECPLIAALRHSPQGTKGQRRLTAAYIPLHQAAHGSFTAQVLKNFLQYPLLRMRWWKRKRLPVAGRRTLFQGHGKAFFPRCRIRLIPA